MSKFVAPTMDDLLADAADLVRRKDEVLASFTDPSTGDVKDGYLNRYDEAHTDFALEALDLLERMVVLAEDQAS